MPEGDLVPALLPTDREFDLALDTDTLFRSLPLQEHKEFPNEIGDVRLLYRQILRVAQRRNSLESPRRQKATRIKLIHEPSINLVYLRTTSI